MVNLLLTSILFFCFWWGGTLPIFANTVAYYRFEEGVSGQSASGTNTIRDSSGNALNGTPFGGVVYSPYVPEDPVPLTGASNSHSLVFDGSSGRIFIPDYPLLILTNSLTVEAFINALAPGGGPYSASEIVFRGDERGGWDPISLVLNNTNLTFQITDTNNNISSVQAPISLNVWHHVAGTLNAATGAQSLYIDGVLVKRISTTERPFGPLVASYHPGWGIGNVESTAYSEYFDGFIDEVRISDTALTPSQFLNAPQPVISSGITDTNINEQVLWQYTPNVSGSGWTFGLSNAPPGMTVNSNSGTISWIPTQLQATQTFSNVTYIVYEFPLALNSTNFDVTVNDINVPPVLNVPPQQLVYDDSTLTVTNTATESDIWATSLTFGLVTAPSGVVLNSNTGVLTWTPTYGQAPSTNTITVSVTDYDPYAVNSQNLSTNNSFIVVVQDVNVPPSLPLINTQTVYARTLLTVTNTAAEPNMNATVTYSLSNPPAGAAINAFGIITWTPTENQSPSTNTITTVATSTDNLDPVNSRISVTNAFTVVVINPAVSISATIPNASDLGPTNGVFTVTRSGGTNGSVLVYYDVSGTAANGVDYSNVTSPVVIPAGNLSTTVTITPILYASPTTGCAVVLTLSQNSFYNIGSPDSASITISQIPPPTLIVPSNQIYVDLGGNLTVTNYVMDPYIPTNQFAFTNISSPPGVNLNPATGVLTWTPSSLGTYIITVGAYDTKAPGFEATSNLTVVVTPPGQPPTNVTISPLSQTVLEGATASFSAAAAGTMPFTYQWYFTNTPIVGATNSTLTLADVHLTNAGSYMVVLSNPHGAATNLTNATLDVVTFTATHASEAYGSPGICIVSCQVGYAFDRSLVELLFEPTLPAGWTLQSVSGEGNPYLDSGDIKFNGSAFPNPLTFAYTASVPAGQTNQQTITDNVVYVLSGTDGLNFPATPNPLQVKYGSFVTVSQQGSQLALTLFGDTGLNYMLQSSTDLINWTDVGTVTPVSGIIQTNVSMTGSNLFFRAESNH
jgi:hypothetical protein